MHPQRLTRGLLKLSQLSIAEAVNPTFGRGNIGAQPSAWTDNFRRQGIDTHKSPKRNGAIVSED
jgi:hypothetical protein